MGESRIKLTIIGMKHSLWESEYPSKRKNGKYVVLFSKPTELLTKAF